MGKDQINYIIEKQKYVSEGRIKIIIEDEHWKYSRKIRIKIFIKQHRNRRGKIRKTTQKYMEKIRSKLL